MTLALSAWSQDEKPAAIPRDTSYTLDSALAKYRKDRPFIEPVRYEESKSGSRKKSVSYHAIGDRELILDIFSPAEDPSAKHPAVVLIHGGGWSSGDRSLMYPLSDYLARHGYVAVPVEYRLSPEAIYPAAVEDLRKALEWIVENGGAHGIDTDKIAILGCSAGGQLAGLVGLTFGRNAAMERLPGGPVRAIVNIDGIMDFTSEEARANEDNPAKKVTAAGRWFGGRYSEKPKLWKEASPIYYVNEHSPPIQFINSSIPRFHAGRDAVIEKLDQFSIPSEVHTFEDAPHSFWLFDPWFEKTAGFVADFLNRVLR